MLCQGYAFDLKVNMERNTCKIVNIMLNTNNLRHLAQATRTFVLEMPSRFDCSFASPGEC